MKKSIRYDKRTLKITTLLQYFKIEKSVKLRFKLRFNFVYKYCIILYPIFIYKVWLNA